MKKPQPQSVHTWITRALQFIIVVGAIFAVYERDWFTFALATAILLLTFLPAMLGRRLNVHIPPEFELIAILFIFASLFLGEIRGYYTRFWWWDVVLHTSSGFLLGILGFLLVYILNQHPRVGLRMKPGFIALFAFCFALAVGAIWEIFEYAMDQIVGTNMQKSDLDTMWDLIVDAAGALVIAVMGYFYLKNGTDSFLLRWIDNFIEKNAHLFRG